MNLKMRQRSLESIASLARRMDVAREKPGVGRF
jgi:hypothetical protein